MIDENNQPSGRVVSVGDYWSTYGNRTCGVRSSASIADIVLRGCLTEKSLVKIGQPSHTRRFASGRGEFSPNGSQSRYSASGRATQGVAVRALASGVADRGFATPFQAPPAINADPPSIFGPPPRLSGTPPAINADPPDFWTAPPRGFQAPPGHQCGPPSDFSDTPSQRMITPWYNTIPRG